MGKSAKQLKTAYGICPICEGGTDPDYRPFCSKRCADIDLGRWMGGRYAIAVTEDSDEDGDRVIADDLEVVPGAARPDGGPGAD